MPKYDYEECGVKAASDFLGFGTCHLPMGHEKRGIVHQFEREDRQSPEYVGLGPANVRLACPRCGEIAAKKRELEATIDGQAVTIAHLQSEIAKLERRMANLTDTNERIEREIANERLKARGRG
jgi:predicted RNase H-like nuclease (RuvC/YqgF family)